MVTSSLLHWCRPYDVKTLTFMSANMDTPPNPALAQAVAGSYTATPSVGAAAPETTTVATPAPRMPGHTAYLTFATLRPKWP